MKNPIRHIDLRLEIRLNIHQDFWKLHIENAWNVPSERDLVRCVTENVEKAGLKRPYVDARGGWIDVSWRSMMGRDKGEQVRIAARESELAIREYFDWLVDVTGQEKAFAP